MSTARPPRRGLRLDERRGRRRLRVSSSPTPTVAELEAALEHAEARTDDVLDITVDDFPLPTLGPELADAARRADQRARASC